MQPVIVVQVRKTYELLRAGWQASGLGVRRHQEREGGTERGELGQAGRRASGGGGGAVGGVTGGDGRWRHLDARECLISQSMVMSMLTWFLAEIE